MSMAGKIAVVPYKNYVKIRNFGDSFNALLIEHVTGIPPRFVGSGRHVLPVGSIFFAATPESHIWGSGIINPEKKLPKFNANQIYALRGKNTVQQLKNLGHQIKDVPLGDPGILANELVRPEVLMAAPRYKAAVIPHHHSWGHPAFKQLKGRDDVVLVDMMTDNPEVLTTLARSEVIISQSLHGLIFAEALGKPSCWISKSLDSEWCFKYHDWQTNVMNPQRAPLLLEAGLGDWLAAAEMRGSLVDKEALKASFPLAQVVEWIDGPLIHHESCRLAGPVRLQANVFAGTQQVFTHKAGVRLPELEEVVGSTLRDFFSSWSYPVYCGLFPSGLNVSRKALKEACRLLDQNTGISFASVVERKFLPSNWTPGTKGVDITSRLLGGGLVIRPSRKFDTSARFATIIV